MKRSQASVPTPDSIQGPFRSPKRRRTGPLVMMALVVACSLPPAAADPAPRPTMAAFEELARGFEALGEACDLQNLDDAFDRAALADTSLQGLDAADNFRQILLESLEQNLRLGRDLCTGLAPDGALTLRRMDATPEGAVALFRAIMGGDTGVNFFKLRLEPSSNGGLVITDFFSYLTGEWQTEQVRRWMVAALGAAQPTLVERLTRKENLFVKHLAGIQQVAASFRAGAFPETLATIAELPRELQQDRTILVIRHQAAAEIDDDAEYLAAMRAIEEAFPSDPSFALALTDRYFLDEDYPGARRVLDLVNRSVGGDSFITYLEATTYLLQDQVEQAKAAFRRSVALEPGFEDAYWDLISISLEEQAYSVTAQLLDEIQAAAGVGLVDLTTMEEYSGFVASAQYQDWIERQ